MEIRGLETTKIDPVWDTELIRLRDELASHIARRSLIELVVGNLDRIELHRFIARTASEADVRGETVFVHESSVDQRLVRQVSAQDGLLVVMGDSRLVATSRHEIMNECDDARIIFVSETLVGRAHTNSILRRWPCISVRQSSWLSLFEHGVNRGSSFPNMTVIANDAGNELRRMPWNEPEGATSVWRLGVIAGVCANLARTNTVSRAVLLLAYFIEEVQRISITEKKVAPEIHRDAMDQFLELPWTSHEEVRQTAKRAVSVATHRRVPISPHLLYVAARGSFPSSEPNQPSSLLDR